MLRRAFIGLTVLAAALAVPVGPAPRPAAADTTFVVDRTDDAPDSSPGNGVCRTASPFGCTLRAAIQEANAFAGVDTIVFAVGFGGITIIPTSALPTITETLIIDGTTQPGFEGLPIVELNGTSAGAGAEGLTVGAVNTVVRGLVINRFLGDGIRVTAGTGSIFALNFIGTDRTGTADLGNGGAGIHLASQQHTIGGADTSASGGPLGGIGNLISGNGGNGIAIATVFGSNHVNGNFIGTNLAGTGPLGNTLHGISINTAPNNQIGTNVIADNVLDGISIVGGGGNDINANKIGTDLTSTANGIGNDRDGIRINTNTGSDNRVTGNDIFFNGLAGVRVLAGLHNSLDINEFQSNGGLGIDLGASGVTANDVDDVDSGPNNLQNFPTFAKPVPAADHVTLQVNLDTVAGKVFGIRYYSSRTCDREGAAVQGGAFDVGTNAAGNVQYPEDFFFDDFPPGSVITATATERSGSPLVFDTSEFSACFTVPFNDTFIVNNTGDAGDASIGDGNCATSGAVCTLRAAIQEANDTSEWDRLRFSIGGGGAQSIAPTTPLPPLATAMTIDGPTQPGFVADPLIELNGTSAGAGANGLVIDSPNVTVRSLAINRFTGDGIEVQDGGIGAIIEASSIGTNGPGTAILGNVGNGIDVLAEDVVIGSGIGGLVRNVISGNQQHGILLRDTADGADVRGNNIGLSRAGLNDLGNSGSGILSSAGGVDIGSFISRSSPGLRNVISGNNTHGIAINGGSARIAGNFIGTTLTGIGTLANTLSGVRVSGDTTFVTLGRELSGAGNVISGNGGDGVALIGAQLDSTEIEGNLIGVSPSGVTDFGNIRSGVFVSSATEVTVGGPEPGARNVISGNDGNGVLIAGFGSAGTVVKGNFIGTNVAGTSALPNTGDGVFVQAPSVAIGGTSRGERNVISGNRHAGVALSATAASGATLFRNLIGTDVNGSADIGNEADGVGVSGAPSATIGGKDPGQPNVISGNNGDGVQVAGTGATGVAVSGNSIGTNAAGTTDLGNSDTGVRVTNGAPGVVVGGSEPAAGNLIAGNDLDGVLVAGSATNGTQVSSNTIGLRTAGLTTALPVPNGGAGVRVNAALDTVVGGQVGQGGNTIGGNARHGVEVAGGASGTDIKGNLIGIHDSDDLGNVLDGVLVNAAPDTTVGGSDPSARNVISDNAGNGVEVVGAASAGTTIQANFIGVSEFGSGFEGNDQHGVLVTSVAGVEIGGSTAGQGNVIGANAFSGVAIFGPNAGGAVIQGNVIGRAGAPIFQGSRNTQNGVQISGANDAVVGGIAPGEANVISDNVQDGVLVTAGVRNRIQGNAIDANDEEGIDLGNDNGPTANDAGDADAGANGLQNFPTLTSAVTGGGVVTLTGQLSSTANTVFAMDVYASPACDDSGFGQGAQYLGTVTLPATNGSGVVTFTNLDVPATVAPNRFIAALATAPTGATSEFSGCVVAPEAFADLEVASVAAPNPVALNGNVTFTDTVENNGPNRSLGTIFTHALGKRLSFQSANSSQGTCQATARRVTCNLGIVPSGGAVTVTVVARADLAGTATTVATVAGDITDPAPENNQATVPVTVN